MPDRLSSNLAQLKASETVAISAEAKCRQAAGEDVLDLGVGEPDFDTPRAVADAAIAAIQAGKTRYPPNAGIRELRVAMAQNLSGLSGGRPVDPDCIMISTELLDTPPARITSGRGPIPLPAGARTLTWYSPGKPGAGPLYSTSASTPPITTCGRTIVSVMPPTGGWNSPSPVQ